MPGAGTPLSRSTWWIRARACRCTRISRWRCTCRRSGSRTPQDYFDRFYSLFGDVLRLTNDHQNPCLRPKIRRMVLCFQGWEKHFLSQHYQEVKYAFRPVEQNAGIQGTPYDLNRIFVAMKATAVPLAEIIRHKAN